MGQNNCGRFSYGLNNSTNLDLFTNLKTNIKMNNILTDNKTLKEFNNVEFINHIMQTGHLHQVATMKIFEEGFPYSDNDSNN